MCPMNFLFYLGMQFNTLEEYQMNNVKIIAVNTKDAGAYRFLRDQQDKYVEIDENQLMSQTNRAGSFQQGDLNQCHFSGRLLSDPKILHLKKDKNKSFIFAQLIVDRKYHDDQADKWVTMPTWIPLYFNDLTDDSPIRFAHQGNFLEVNAFLTTPRVPGDDDSNIEQHQFCFWVQHYTLNRNNEIRKAIRKKFGRNDPTLGNINPKLKKLVQAIQHLNTGNATTDDWKVIRQASQAEQSQAQRYIAKSKHANKTKYPRNVAEQKKNQPAANNYGSNNQSFKELTRESHRTKQVTQPGQSQSSKNQHLRSAISHQRLQQSFKKAFN